MGSSISITGLRAKVATVLAALARVLQARKTIVRGRRKRRETSIQPELWVDSPHVAITFYEAASGATVLHRVGDGDGIVAQLGVGERCFAWQERQRR
jgi:hypothetical protein